jgi:RNA polymerase sigma factor (sigma-70 family)
MKADKQIRSDEGLLEGLRERDSSTLHAIYRLYFPGFSRYVAARGGAREDAEDIFQDALIVVYRKAKAGTLRLSSSFHTYLFAVCKLIWRKKQSAGNARPAAPSPQAPEIAETTELEALATHGERYALFRSKFELLDQPCRKLLTLFFQGESMQAIARSLGFGSVNYASKRKFQCKERLIDLIKADRRYEELL